MMGRCTLALLIAVCMTGCRRDPNKTDAAQLQGTWEALSVERIKDGSHQKFAQPNITAIFDGDKLTMRYGNDPAIHTYRLDAKQSPRHIDITGAQGTTSLGLYEINGDDLKFIQGKERPTDFSISAGRILMTLRRVKN